MFSNTFWVFCPKCGWQADEPNTGMKPDCPECGHEVHITSPDVGEESAFLEQIAEVGVRQFCIDSGLLAGKVQDISKTLPKVVDTGTKMPLVDPAVVVKALGADMPREVVGGGKWHAGSKKA